ncbi:UDP-glucose dehydrogenase family protein [Dactylosporangium matsuzakiense]|uniref:UDP-glucose 6-dehydrogenase n=1 Tax=Dactylosporangium matsuzakiense TaxID=53360 RepID=A0A9W6KRN6_9ACTN|nr:UDP-glucose/GDP-mannose dehydrogenase family protein [Dactylosporangium matsuzakiense]GLL06916.1 UDP-glucose 6-dehydrogenase [Dactylosporangium matsuzakiense]
MKISIIGCGRLGAPYAAGMAGLGHHVLGLDTDPDTIAALRAGKAPFAEPGLAEAITDEANSGRLTFTDAYARAAEHADVHFLAVPTPQAADSDHHDLSILFAAAEALARHLRRDSLVVVKSSVPAGTSARVAARMAEIAGPGVTIEVAASPDFMQEGCSIADVRRPTRIVLGVQPGGVAETTLRELWAPCLAAGVPLVVTDWPTAELCKLAANGFLATRISYVNALAAFCGAAGANITDLAAAVGHDPRIGADYLTPGLGFGGSCLSKDLRGFVAMAQSLGVGDSFRLLTTVDEINQQRRQRAVAATLDALGGAVAGQPVTVWGAAFKPGIDDVRDSPALDVAKRLHQAGAAVTVYDPQAMDLARAECPHLKYATDPVTAVEQARVLLHLTGWPQFAEIDPADLRPAPNPVLLDARGGLSQTRWTGAGWTVYPL